MNHEDPKYGISLLRWAIANRKYYSFQQLLELNANPDQIKMEIVDSLEAIGYDYRKTAIPEYLHETYSRDF